MRRVQRQFGKFVKRSADHEDIGAALAEFNETERALTTFIEATKAWQSAWSDILQEQLLISENFAAIYKPIENDGVPSTTGHVPMQTPKKYLDKTGQLQSTYYELQIELLQEIKMIDAKLVRPAMDARESMKLLKNVIKRREDCKLDYERYHSRADHARRKEAKSVKEETTLSKHENDESRALDEYTAADNQLKKGLPPVTAAVYSLFPHLLATAIMLQHSLVGTLYTSLSDFCQRHEMPVPAPAMEDIISLWDAEFTPMRHEIESSVSMIANGKAVHQPMTMPENNNTISGLGLRNKIAQRRTTSQGGGFFSKPGASQLSQTPELVQTPFGDEEEDAPPARPPRPSFGAQTLSERPRISSGRPSFSSSAPGTPYGRIPSASDPASPRVVPDQENGESTGKGTPYGTPKGRSTPMGSSYGAPGGTQGDYFTRNRSSSSVSSSIAAKKKPPPPPPAKRMPSMQSQFVMALYDFPGQNPGDLAFREGDRIRVVKKTDSTDDWWDGELNGMKGSFPANYVRVG